MSFSNRIKVLRAERNMTQDELATTVGVRRETILHLESNRYMPSLKLAYDIARLFGKRVEEVFIFSDDEDASV